VSIYITNTNASTGVDYYDMYIQWSSSVIGLATNTSADFVEGGYMKAFGSTIFPGAKIYSNYAEIPCGFLTGGPAKGNGTLFTVAFHCIAPGTGNITIQSPNVVSYLLNVAQALIPFTAVNGVANQPPRPPTPPVAIITSPINFTSYTVGATVILDGSHSTPGYNTLPALGETCPITSWTWTVTLPNSTVWTLTGNITSIAVSITGTWTISLTLIAPVPDSYPTASGYVDTSSASVTIYVVPKAVGPKIVVYTDRSAGIPGWSDAYGPLEQVCVYANVTYNGAPVWYIPVEFVVYSNNGSEVALFTQFTNESGIAKVCFVPGEGSSAEKWFGNWSIFGTVSILGVQENDTVKFPYGYLLSIPVNGVSLGANQYNEKRLGTMSINFTIDSMAMKRSKAFLVITAVDNCSEPIGIVSATIDIPASGYSETVLTISIPSWAAAGYGKVHVDLLQGTSSGTPYCPEVAAPFDIVYP
jgi:hypothetical protein